MMSLPRVSTPSSVFITFPVSPSTPAAQTEEAEYECTECEK